MQKSLRTLGKQVPLICLPDDTIIWVAGLKRSNFASIGKTDAKIVFFTITKERIS